MSTTRSTATSPALLLHLLLLENDFSNFIIYELTQSLSLTSMVLLFSTCSAMHQAANIKLFAPREWTDSNQVRRVLTMMMTSTAATTTTTTMTTAATTTSTSLWRERVDLSNVREMVLGGERNVTDALLVVIATHCSQLTHLDLQECSDVTDIGLIAIGESCQQLVVLDLCSCRNITDLGVIVVAGHCRSLNSFNLRSCDKISDAGLMAIADHCRMMMCLDIAHCYKVTNVGVNRLVRLCQRMSTLCVFDCGDVTNETKEIIREKYLNVEIHG